MYGKNNSVNKKAMKPSGNECLVIRVDASTQMGTGHLMRCLALGQAWRDSGGHVVFAMAMKAPKLEMRLQSEGMEVIHLPARPGGDDDAIQTVQLTQQRGASWIVADGYHFGADYQRIIKEAGLRLLFIDDDGQAEPYYADIVLNQNLHARESFYARKESYTRLLLGIRYVLLRREFLQRREWRREIPEVAREVLVTLGGGDPDNVTMKIVQALQRMKVDGLEAVVVVGGSNPHYEELQSAIKDSQISIRLQRNVTNMPDLMAGADLAISSGGTTVWELAFMGLPALVGVIAPIEELLLDGLKQQCLFIHIGWFSQLSVEQLAEALIAAMEDRKMRNHASFLGRKLVDGYGADRVLEAMNEKLAEK